MELLKKTAAFRVDKQTEGKPADEVSEISLNGVPFLPELISSFVNLRHLTLISMKPPLTSLSAIPLSIYTQLRVLDVSDNAIRVSEPLPSCPSLQRLYIANNKITNMIEMELIAQSCTALVVLDVLNNPVDTSDTFTAIFNLFPKLEVLNGKTENGSNVSVRDSDESDSSEYDDEDEEDEEEEEEEEEEEDGVNEIVVDESDSDDNNDVKENELDRDSDSQPEAKKARIKERVSKLLKLN